MALAAPPLEVAEVVDEVDVDAVLVPPGFP